MANALWGYTIFCDDIRSEQGGKHTFVGVYDGTMHVHGDFPFALPKFGMAVRYIEERGLFRDEEVVLNVFMPGDDESSPSIQGTLPLREVRLNSQFHANDQAKYLQVGTIIVLAPTLIAKPGAIRVRAECGSEIVNLGSLQVLKAPTPPNA